MTVIYLLKNRLNYSNHVSKLKLLWWNLKISCLIWQTVIRLYLQNVLYHVFCIWRIHIGHPSFWFAWLLPPTLLGVALTSWSVTNVGLEGGVNIIIINFRLLYLGSEPLSLRGSQCRWTPVGLPLYVLLWGSTSLPLLTLAFKPAFRIHCCPRCRSLDLNVGSSLTWNWGETKPVSLFRIRAMFLPYNGDRPRCIPTFDLYLHLWYNFFGSWSSLTRTKAGHPNGAQCLVFI